MLDSIVQLEHQKKIYAQVGIIVHLEIHRDLFLVHLERIVHPDHLHRQFAPQVITVLIDRIHIFIVQPDFIAPLEVINQ